MNEDNPYAAIPDAIELIESGGDIHWQMLTVLGDGQPDKIIRLVTEGIDHTLLEAPAGSSGRAFGRRCREQVQRPEFRTWVAGKLGLI